MRNDEYLDWENKERGYVDGDPPNEQEGIRFGPVQLHDRHVSALKRWMPPTARFGPDPNAPEPEPEPEPKKSPYDDLYGSFKKPEPVKPDPGLLAMFEAAGYWRNTQRHVERDGIRAVAFLAAEGLLPEGADPVEVLRELVEVWREQQ